MEQPRFYILRDDPSDKEFNATDIEEINKNRGEAPCCPACGEPIDMLRWLPPYVANLELWGQDFGDILFAGGDSLLVSERFVNAYSQTALSGLSGFDPVKIVRVKRHVKGPKTPPLYYHVTVARSQAEVDEAQSGFEREKPVQCRVCHAGGILKRAKRIIIDPAEWKGEDIFIARGFPGDYVVTKRFRDMCVANDIKNATLIPAEQYSFDFYPWEQSRDSSSESVDADNEDEPA